MKPFTVVLFLLGILLFITGKVFFDINNFYNPLLSITGIILVFFAVLLLIWNKVSKS
ncbi:MAG: hypothetical protein NDI80_02940 [Flavobacteriaceae bacterium]|nr:hypothetical protein [Flavobacteriaceae bacterium]